MRTLLIFLMFLLAACGSPTPDSAGAEGSGMPTDEIGPDMAHNSRNALDWPGTYTGTLPCADCDGIRTTITLRDDGTFERELIYLGKSAEPARQSGLFAWNEAGSAVTLALEDGTTQMYQVGENQLIHLDRSGNRISGDLAAQYVLRQSVHDPRIEDRRWLLVEAMGQPYAPAEDRRAAFILLDSDASRVTGNSSCNNFFGQYVLEAGSRIRFDKLGATMMACPDMTTERSVMEALRKVDNYAVNGNRLALHRARMAPLLRFELADDDS